MRNEFTRLSCTAMFFVLFSLRTGVLSSQRSYLLITRHMKSSQPLFVFSVIRVHVNKIDENDLWTITVVEATVWDGEWSVLLEYWL